MDNQRQGVCGQTQSLYNRRPSRPYRRYFCRSANRTHPHALPLLPKTHIYPDYVGAASSALAALRASPRQQFTCWQRQHAIAAMQRRDGSDAAPTAAAAAASASDADAAETAAAAAAAAETAAAAASHPPADSADSSSSSSSSSGNSLLLRMPFLAHALLQQLPNPSFVALATTCRAWRAAALGALEAATPKSELALAFLQAATGLRSLELSHTAPSGGRGHSSGCFHHISRLTHLTYLGLKCSETRAWQGHALQISDQDLWFAVHLHNLQVLQLSHQPCLQQPGVLAPLAQLPLQQLGLSIVMTGWRPCVTSWQILATLTGLRQLDISGWSVARVPASSSSSEHAAPDAAAGSHPASAAAASRGHACSAPLHLLGSLSRLQQLVMTDWSEPPSRAGLAAVLRQVSDLDISRCGITGWQSPNEERQAGAAVSLTALLAGTTPRQQQQQQDQGASVQQQPGQGSDAETVSSSLPKGPTLQTRCLRRLTCMHAYVQFDAATWAALSGLEHLDVTACPRMRGHGLTHLTGLQTLIAQDCPQLDYDAVAALLASARELRRLDLQGAGLILHGDGDTARAMRQGRYHRPVLGRAPWQQQQQQQQPQGAASASDGGQAAARPASSSRRDAADVSGADAASKALHGSLTLSAGGAQQQQQQQQQRQAPAHALLHELCMTDCGLAFEQMVWEAPPPDDGEGPPGSRGPAHPALLLFDLVAQAAQRVRVLDWGHASSQLTGAILERLVPAAAGSLRALRLVGGALPADVSRCWQGLAAASGLTQLDLSSSGLTSRHSYSTHTGSNPTASLVAACAGMRSLRELGLGQWRWFFATLKPLAGLGPCLRVLDLTSSRDLTDGVLWSLTNLTALTRLHINGAQPTTAAVFPMICAHLTCLRHLDASDSRFSESLGRSLPQLPNLTHLDMRSSRSSHPLTADDVRVLTGLIPAVAWLAVTIESSPHDQAQQHAAAYLSGGLRHPTATPSWGRARRSFDAGDPRDGGGGGGGGDGDGRPGGELGSSSASVLALFGRCQSLRTLCIGSDPEVAERARGVLPPWIVVH